MTKEERTAHWHSIIEKQAESGKSVAAYCRECRIKPHQFYYWRRRLRSNQFSGSSNGFLELVPYAKQTESGIRINLGDELSIEVQRGFDPFTLRSAIEVLRGERK
jgi:hypothetical protein